MGKNKRAELYIKYLCDKIIALLGLLLVAPLFLIVGTVLKLQREEIFFLQKRVGYLGKEFNAFKFTTMPKGSEKLGLITTIKDQRLTGFGRFLRKTKINEIPQLINVLIGDMSLVGPRPLVKEQIAESLTKSEIKEYYRMRPGLTGAGSLYFHREDKLLSNIETPHKYYREIIIPEKQKLEREYVNRWSLLLDLKIIVLTVIIFAISTFGASDGTIERFLDIKLGF